LLDEQEYEDVKDRIVDERSRHVTAQCRGFLLVPQAVAVAAGTWLGTVAWHDVS
jgi:hypothetical protein